MSSTLQQISKRLGVSQMTVSRGLRGVAGVSEPLRQRIRATAQELEYSVTRQVVIPTSLARGGQDASMDCLILVPRPYRSDGPRDSGSALQASSEYTREVAAGIESRLKAVDGELHLAAVSTYQDIEAALQQHKVDAVILRGSLPLAWIDRLRRKVCVISATAHDLLTDLDCIWPNEQRAATQVECHLENLGHERITWFGINDYNYVGFEKTAGASRVDRFFSTSSTRYMAWNLFCHCNPRLYRQSLVLVPRDHKRHSLADAVSRGLDRILNTKKQRPTALVVATLYMLDEVMSQLPERGLRVPEDISVVGYGIASQYEWWPHLRSSSHIRLPMQRIGECVPELAERRLATPDAEPVSIQIQAKFMAGDTTAELKS